MQCGRTSSALAVHVSVHKELEAAAGPLGSSSTSSLLLESGDDVGGFLGAGLSAGFAFLCRLLRALLRLLPRWRSSAGSSVPRRIGATGAGPANVEALGPAGLSPGGVLRLWRSLRPLSLPAIVAALRRRHGRATFRSRASSTQPGLEKKHSCKVNGLNFRKHLPD